MVVASLVVAAAFLTERDAPDAETLLSHARQTMEQRSFSVQGDNCEACHPEALMQFAPRRLYVYSPDVYERVPYWYLDNGVGYVSNHGKRWMTGDDLTWFGLLRFSDPRLLLEIAQNPRVTGTERIDSRTSFVVETEIDLDAFLDQDLFEKLDAVSRDAIRAAIARFSLRFWLADDDYRVLRFEQATSEGASDFRLDYESPVVLPDSVVSMDGWEAQRLNREAEETGRLVQAAIREYALVYETFPPSADAQTLASFLSKDNWPENPFTGQPMKEADDSPGDFTYVVKQGGEHAEFSLHGWDGIISYYDSERFGR